MSDVSYRRNPRNLRFVFGNGISSDILPPHPGLERLVGHFTHGFTVGYFLSPLRGCHLQPQIAEHPDFFARLWQLDIQPDRGGSKLLRPISKLG